MRPFPMPTPERVSDSETSSSDSDVDNADVKKGDEEDDPAGVNFHFLKTGKSSKEGVLITHDHFKYTKNNTSRDYKTYWYTCSYKGSHGCRARAIVKRHEFTGEDGDLYVENVLVKVSTPEVHARYHAPDQAAILADHIMVKIKEQIDQNPIMPVGRARDSILREVNLKYEKDPSLLAEIISALPKKMESSLNQHKNRLLGSLPKTLDDFDPSSLLAKLEGGDKILVMDSNRDLPENWKDIDMKETFGVVEEASDDINPSNGGSDDCATDDASTSDEGATSDEATAPADVDEDDNEEYQDVAANSTINVENAKKPKRVLIFTTVMMLGLLAVCKNGSVDGTFKAMTRKWKQLFIFMVNYRGSFLPVAFGWLPNKHAISYHVFLLLLLLRFRENQVGIIDLYGRGSLKLKKIKLDFELAIHRAFETLFKLKGCYFHFSQAAWRKVQKGGMVVSYMSEKKFRDFIRSVVALAFLPLNQIEAAIDELKAVEFEKDSPAYEQMTKFREEHLEYIESTWLYGSFQPKLWNQWKKSRNLTNNHNEGYNSRINKILNFVKSIFSCFD